MSAVAAAIGVGAVATIGGAYMESNAANNAANTQAAAANNASQLQYQEFEQQQANQQPYMQAGQGALSQMQNPYYQQQFNMQDFQESPSYQFDLSQGQQAISRSAAASGSLASGNTLKALNNYSQQQATNDYQQAYSNFNNNQTQSYNRLASLAGLGQTSTGQINSAGQNMANQVGQNTMGAANAEGAAGIASANAYGSALSGIGQAPNTLMGYQQLQNQTNLTNSLVNGQQVPGYSMPALGSSSLSSLGSAPNLGTYTY